MLAILNNNPILSKEGNKVYGRFYVFQKDTNRKATVYTYDSNNHLVTAQNPVYTDDFGFPEFEVILENQIYSIVVEEYLGNYDDPKSDDRSEMWNVCNSYYLGEVEDKESNGTVYSASSLADADISLGEIKVIGYWNSFDCEERTFIWDPTSIDTADDGYVFRSNKSSVGRWILLNNLPYIPSEYYGVYPGHLENMGKLTTCPETLGKTYNITVPNCIKFASGTYDLNDSIYANTNGRTRSILVDNKTCFGNKYSVHCEGITVLGEVRKDDNKYIGKLYLPAVAEAKYSWFPTLDSFFDCAQNGSEVLVVDSYGIDNELKFNHILRWKTIKFEGGKIDWTGSGSLTIDNCTIIGESKTFTNGSQIAHWDGFSWKTKFKNMEVSDKFILGTSKPTCENCTYTLAHFNSTKSFLEYKLAANQTEIDLAGGYIDTVVISQKSEVTLINANITNLSTYNVKTLILKNSHIEKLNCGTSISSVRVYNSKIDGYEQYGTLSIFETNNSYFITSKGIKTKSASIVSSLINGLLEITEEGSVFDSFTTSIEAEKIYLENCSVNGSVEGYDLNISNSTLHHVVWPKAKYDGSEWKIKARISNCTFRNPRNGGTNQGISLKREGTEDQVVLDGLYVTGCSFQQTGTTVSGKDFIDGISLEVFGNREDRFLHDDPTRHKWAWEGNSGNCIQPWLKTNKSVSQDSHTYGDFRFLLFGINGSRTGKVVPYQVEIMPIENKATTVSTYKYFFTAGNFGYGTMYITQYDVSDYFKFRVSNSNWAYNGSFQFEIEPLRRYGESDRMG